LTKFFAIILIFAACAIFVSGRININYWLQPADRRLQISMSNDWQKLAAQRLLPTQLSQVSQVDYASDASQASEWIKTLGSPVKRNPQGGYQLNIYVIQWIDGHDQGAIVQYDLLEKKTQNKIWEMSRSYKIGFIY
jgi:hypothetical protein